MEAHFKLSDNEFVGQFEDGKLDPSLFSHEAHLRLAYLHIKNFGIENAIYTIQSQLKKFAEWAGAPGKYNVTLTVAAVKAVYHFILKSESTDFKDFITEFPRLKFNFKELMSCHYGFEIYNSEKAKSKFLEPDLLPFE